MENLLLTGAAAGALAAVGHVVIVIYRIAKRIDIVRDAVERELLPNGGSSLKDQIGRIDRRVSTIETTLGMARAQSLPTLPPMLGGPGQVSGGEEREA